MKSKGWVWLVLPSALAACGPRKPAVVAMFPGEVTLYVAVSNQVAKNDHGNVAAMVDAIDSDLHDDGRVTTIVGARLDEKPPVPRIELQVMSSSGANLEVRGAGNLGLLLGPVGTAFAGGMGDILVDAYAVQVDGRSAYLGRYSANSFGALGDETVAAGERVGHRIARKIR